MTNEEIKDELYRMLSDVVNGGYPIRNNTQKGRYREAVKEAIKALEQEPEWIPVSERLPEDGEEVLCFLGSEEMAVLFRRNDWGQDEWVDGRFATGTYDVEAWMPLPESYKAESEDKE